MSVSLKFRY